MSKRKSKPKPKRQRRKHSEEFKREAVKLVLDEGLSVAEAARNFGVHASVLGRWTREVEGVERRVLQGTVI